MIFKQDQLQLISDIAEDQIIAITCSGQMRDLVNEMRLYANSNKVGYIFNSDLLKSSDDSPVYIIERIDENIDCIDDLSKIVSYEHIQYPINEKPVTSAKIKSVEVANSGNVGIMLPQDMYNKDLSTIDTLIIMYDSNEVSYSTLKLIVNRYIKEQSTSYMGEHTSLGFVNVSSMSVPKNGEKCWRRIVFEDTKGRYIKSEVANRLSGDNVMVISAYKTDQQPKYSLDMLIGGNR